VPELVGLTEADAVALIEQQGLRVRFAEPRFDDQVAEGHVLSHEPQGRVARGGTVTLTLSRGPEVYAVPDIIGADVAVATRQLEGMGLAVVEADRRYSDTVPEGRVLTVEPAVGEQVVPGDTVTITVSQGRAPIDVPSLVGKHVDEARAQLGQLGLVAEVAEVENNAPQGEVVNQDPSPGSGAEPGDVIRLEISQGPPTRPVPGVEGERCQRAADILEEAGFEVTFGGRDRGRVAIQSPSAGTGLPPGSPVTIFCI
jgi:beta-lactam-binding protein with PASTA domain